MNSEISKKIIFSSFLFINLIHPSKSSNFHKKHQSDHNKSSQLSWQKIFNNKTSLSSSVQLFNNNTEQTTNKNNFSEDNPHTLVADLINKQEELVIQSDKQSEKNNVIYAEGDVYVSYRGKQLRADSIIFDKLDKKLIAEGNITLVFGEQILKLSKLEYNFKDEKGFLLEVTGYLISDKLITDISGNFNNSDTRKINYLLGLQKKKVVNTPNRVNNWIFSAQKITIDGKKWKSDKAIFSNDILQFKQVKMEINSLEVYSLKDELRFKSSLNYLVLDENVSIPFWLGNRAITKSGQNLDSKSSWDIGYDKLDKDGLFISRKLNSINIFDDFSIDLEPQFLIQRSLNGHTNSFVKKGDLITGEKVKRDINFADFFGFESQIKGKVKNWDLEINNQINSLDINKINDSLRSSFNLNKELNFLNANWDKSFYGVYRDRVWNGSLGEAEIYLGYGSKLEKKDIWEVNETINTEILSFGLAHLKAEQLNSKNLVDSFKGNFFYSFEKKIPLNVYKPKNKIIDSSHEYIHEPIKKGFSLTTKVAASYSLYDDGNHQEYIGIGLGPELILGNLKTKTFDYTRIGIFPFYKFKNGESVFKFDQIADKFTLNIGFDQQLFGPIILKSDGTLNLDNDSDDYGEFIDSKISLNWKKRSYEVGVFYQPHNQSGGISFSLFGFK